MFLNPRPALASLASHYDCEDYDPFVSLSDSGALFDRIYRAARRFTTRWKRRRVQRLVPPGSSVLDIGCGTGEFLKALSDDYFTEGVEPDPNAAQWARERLGLAVYTGGIEQLEGRESAFDLALMWHVLEHIPEPLDALIASRRLLKPQGKLLIALPNHEALDAKIYGARWVAYDAPRHLWHFSRGALVKLASRAGFKLLRCGMMPLDTFYNVLLSEKLVARSGGRGIFLPVRMPAAILGSIALGFFTRSHSSMYYIFERS